MPVFSFTVLNSRLQQETDTYVTISHISVYLMVLNSRLQQETDTLIRLIVLIAASVLNSRLQQETDTLKKIEFRAAEMSA